MKEPNRTIHPHLNMGVDYSVLPGLPEHHHEQAYAQRMHNRYHNSITYNDKPIHITHRMLIDQTRQDPTRFSTLHAQFKY